MQWKIKTFSELTVEELYAILRLRSEVFIVEQNCAYQDIDNVDQRSIHVWLEEDHMILGYLRYFDKTGEPETAQIGRVVTSVRGKGYGAEVLNQGIMEILGTGLYEEIYLEAQVYAIPFYEKAGFRVTSDEFLEDGIPHVEMRRTLK